MRHHSAVVLLAALGCGDDSSQLPDSSFPAGDPDGGTVKGTITTDLAATSGGLMFVGAFTPDGGPLVAGIALGERTFPVDYQMDLVPAGSQVIRAVLDLPPYARRPLVDPPGPEDAWGVYLNANSILPVSVRPFGGVTSGVDFFVTRH